MNPRQPSEIRPERARTSSVPGSIKCLTFRPLATFPRVFYCSRIPTSRFRMTLCRVRGTCSLRPIETSLTIGKIMASDSPQGGNGTRQVALHVNFNDPERLNYVLNNAENILSVLPPERDEDRNPNHRPWPGPAYVSRRYLAGEGTSFQPCRLPGRLELLCLFEHQGKNGKGRRENADDHG